MALDMGKLGISPINWVNEDVLSLGDHYTFEDLLTDFSSLGFRATENCRKFPKDPQILKAALAEKDIQLSSQWKGVCFSDPSRREEELRSYRQHIEFLHQMGAKHVVTCELGGSIIGDPRRPGPQDNIIPLSPEEWNHMVEGLHQAGSICREYDMKLVYHFHIGTVVERPDEIDRLMETTDPELVHLLYDTGHAYYGGYDPLELLRKHGNRVAYVHLKDIRQSVLDEVIESNIRFQSAVIRGVFTVPGDGCIDFEPIFQELSHLGYSDWMIIEAEQDPGVANPVEYAKLSKQYIEGLVAKTCHSSLHISGRKQADEKGNVLAITPESAGWEYVGFEVFVLKQGQSMTKQTGLREACLVLLSGLATVETSELRAERIGSRMSIFEKTPPYSVYVPNDDYYEVVALTDLELAVCTAPGNGGHKARVILPEHVGVEMRGYGNMERQIHNILPESQPADHLLVVEVFTPGGHWSSYPPHKHDQDNLPHESYLEETYYHRVNPAQGFALQRVYTDDLELNEVIIAQDGDAVLVLRGYHPVSAPPGYDVYYLNVMAGPKRVWKFHNDPNHEWLMSVKK